MDIDQFVEHHTDFKTLVEALRTSKASPESSQDALQLLEELGFDPNYLDMLLSGRAAQQESAAVSVERRSCFSGRRDEHILKSSALRRVMTPPMWVFRAKPFVYRKLLAKFGSDRVQWINKNGEGRFLR